MFDNPDRILQAQKKCRTFLLKKIQLETGAETANDQNQSSYTHNLC
jgi:hypothetical protein